MGIKKVKLRPESDFWTRYQEEEALELASQIQKNMIIHKDHAKPVSRRDFLAMGVISGSATVFGSSILGKVFNPSQNALAQTCDTTYVPGGGVPVYEMVLSGGNSPLAHFSSGIAGNAADFGNLPVETHRTFGVGDPIRNNLDFSMGMPMFRGAFHAGLNAGIRGDNQETDNALTQAVKGRCNGITYLARSNNDTSSNAASAISILNSCRVLAGASGGGSGKFTEWARMQSHATTLAENSFDASHRFTTIQDTADAADLANFASFTQTFGVSTNAARSVWQHLTALNNYQVGREPGSVLPDVVKQFNNCQVANGVRTLDNPGVLTIDQEIASVQAIYNGTTAFRDQGGVANLTTGSGRRNAAINTLIFNGNALGGSYNIGGMDYHNQGGVTNENKDYDAGVLFGQALRHAYEKGLAACFLLVTDGSASHASDQPNGDANTRYNTPGGGSDYSNGACLVQIFINGPGAPGDGRPVMTKNSVNNRGAQFGALNSGGTDNNADPLVSNVRNGAVVPWIMALNYLHFIGRPDLWLQVAQGKTELVGQESNYVAVAKGHGPNIT